ncbi:MAG TPA: ABC transporter permease subunit [Gaiellaceae bacterium]|jgi:alpha-glucoside transport system permease protein|nr:ABC transporter permease subunit [Gaiellaceae bacterium]
MSGAGQAAAAPPPAAPAPSAGEAGGWRKYALAAGFLAPSFFFIGIWIIYPAIRTIFRSFYDRTGDSFVGFDNFVEIFTQETLVTAVKNNALWIAIVPAFVTAVGLVFAVLIERIRWTVAFRFCVFMPMAISAFAAGITWRIMYIEEPERGALNASIASVKDAVDPPGVLSEAASSTEDLEGNPEQGGLVYTTPVGGGDTVLLGLTRIAEEEVPEDAQQAVQPEPLQGGITGVVWRDFKPGGGEAGVVEQDEVGLSGVTVELRSAGGGTIAETTSGPDGAFSFENVEGSDNRVAIGEETFAEPFSGVSWLGEKLITPSIMVAYIWIWAGFAMVVIAAGLSSLPRDVIEAARTDGANERQIFRRVTVPLLWPIIMTVFVTMLINVLKVFDIVISLAPGSVQDDANVLALAMWRESFTGALNFGVGSAIAVFIFVLVGPIMVFNVRNFRRQQ